MKRQELCQKCIEILEASLGPREAAGVIDYILNKYIIYDAHAASQELGEDKIGLVYDAVGQVLKGKPVQYVVGEASFMNLNLFVDERVLIPRPETEELVYWVEKEIIKTGANSILDVGTGSGCIAIYLKKKFPAVEVNALDISEAALEVARMNAINYNADINFIKMDFLLEIPELKNIDVIISNPPYISQQEKKLMTPWVINYEPSIALFPIGDDPLIFYKILSQLGNQILL
ncbi:MAG: peptide chain release factor N(5)-glutamine methyltransferase, partial [Bacteroidota bacterium]|nr:peptide chain release factor N(5)-glutamine methyltransferase [Bacteroidota bacterium]